MIQHLHPEGAIRSSLKRDYSSEPLVGDSSSTGSITDEFLTLLDETHRRVKGQSSNDALQAVMAAAQAAAQLAQKVTAPIVTKPHAEAKHKEGGDHPVTDDSQEKSNTSPSTDSTIKTTTSQTSSNSNSNEANKNVSVESEQGQQATPEDDVGKQVTVEKSSDEEVPTELLPQTSTEGDRGSRPLARCEFEHEPKVKEENGGSAKVVAGANPSGQQAVENLEGVDNTNQTIEAEGSKQASDNKNSSAKLSKDLPPVPTDSNAVNAAQAATQQRGLDTALRARIVQQVLETLRAAFNIDGPKNQGPTQGNNASQTVTAATQSNKGQAASDNAKSAKSAPKLQQLRTLERVESALREIARSKDGKTISLQIDPPQLGKVRADVTLKNGTLHARLTPENGQVLSMLREHAPELQASLRRLGLNVETITVSVASDWTNGFTLGDGSSDLAGNNFRDDRQNMPSESGQHAETTVGNELAGSIGGSVQKAKTNTLDHWIA